MKIKNKIILVILITILLISSIFTPSFAINNQTVIINKISPHPSLGRELIELRNLSNQDIDITDWYFKDNGEKCSTADIDTNKLIFYKDQVDTKTFKTIESRILKPTEIIDFYVVSKLNDTGDSLNLCKKINGTEDNFIDNIQYCKTINKDEIVEKESDNTVSIISIDNKKSPACDTPVTITPTIQPTNTPSITPAPILTLTPTPKLTPSVTLIPTSTPILTQTITPTISISPTTTTQPINYKDWKIELSKIYPYTSTGEESIEIYNDGNEDRNLNGWILDDSKSTSSKFKTLNDKDIIKTKSSLLLTIKSSVLNNSGDDVYLIAPDNSEIDKFTYTDTPKDGYWEFKNNKWEAVWDHSQDTGNQEDRTGSILGTSDELISIKNARTLNLDENVRVEGIVTVKADLLSKNIFYIQDSTGGIRVDSDENLDFKDGDRLEVIGILSETRNEKRINADTVKFIKKENLIKPQNVKISAINENLEGQLLNIKGIVSKTSGNTLEITDSTGTITVSISDTTGIKKPYTRTDYFADISGILSQYGTKDGKPYYRILPRYQEDVKIGKTENELTNTGVNIAIGITAGLSILLLLLFINKQKLLI